MTTSKKILFVGNFLSASKGTLGVTETLSRDSAFSSISMLAGFSQSKYFRFFEILFSLIMAKADIIHVDIFSGRSFLISYISVKIGKWRKKKVYGTLHGGRLHEYFEENKNFVKRTLKEFDKLASPSLFLIRYFENEEISLTHIPNSIELTNYQKKEEYDFSKINMLWVRAFAEIYNPEIAVYILKTLKERGYDNSILTMVGPDHGQQKNTELIIKNLGLQDSITITGPIQNKLLFKYFANHEFFLNTSSYESFGIANLEAAASGLLLVSHSIGEIPYLWTNNKDAILVDSLDPNKFADEVIRLFNNRTIFNTITSEGRRLTEEYDRNIVIEKWKDFFGLIDKEKL